jgi:hypothetical protein
MRKLANITPGFFEIRPFLRVQTVKHLLEQQNLT